MSQTITKSFTAAAQVSDPLQLKDGDRFSLSITGTFVATLILEKSSNLNGWEQVARFTATSSNSYMAVSKDQAAIYYRLRCSAYTSGTAVTSILDIPKAEMVRNISAAGAAKAGATSGFVVAVADDISLVTCPASKTASTCVIPLNRLMVGDVITGFYLVGQIESAGGTVTVDADLRVMTAAAADVTDASVGAITQLSVAADSIMSRDNTAKLNIVKTVGADENYYILITATTAGSTDIALQGVGLIFKA